MENLEFYCDYTTIDDRFKTVYLNDDNGNIVIIDFISKAREEREVDKNSRYQLFEDIIKELDYLSDMGENFQVDEEDLEALKDSVEIKQFIKFATRVEEEGKVIWND